MGKKNHMIILVDAAKAFDKTHDKNTKNRTLDLKVSWD